MDIASVSPTFNLYDKELADPFAALSSTRRPNSSFGETGPHGHGNQFRLFPQAVSSSVWCCACETAYCRQDVRVNSAMQTSTQVGPLHARKRRPALPDQATPSLTATYTFRTAR